jgi:hypothetical protein
LVHLLHSFPFAGHCWREWRVLPPQFQQPSANPPQRNNLNRRVLYFSY